MAGIFERREGRRWFKKWRDCGIVVEEEALDRLG